MRATLAFLVLGCLAASAPAAGADDWEALSVRVKPFVVKDLQGKPLKLADLTGKIAVIDFWATWCKPCVHELPGLAEYHRRLESQETVVLLSFNVGETRRDVEAFLKRSPVSFPVYFGDALVEPLELAAFPTKLIVDARKPGPGGSALLRYRREGLTTVVSIEAKVAELLAETP